MNANHLPARGYYSVGMIVVVTNSHAHVPLDVVRHSDRDRQTEDGMRHSEGVDVAIPAEDLAGYTSGDQARDQEYRIGNMRQAEESGAQQYCAPSRNQFFKAQEKIRLQNELLQDSPDRVAARVSGLRDGSK